MCSLSGDGRTHPGHAKLPEGWAIDALPSPVQLGVDEVLRFFNVRVRISTPSWVFLACFFSCLFKVQSPAS